MKGVTPPLAREIERLRTGVARHLRARDARGARELLRSRYNLAGSDAGHVVRYVAQQLALSDVPESRRPIVEIYRMDRMQTAVFHTCAGRRVNETLARIVGARVFAAARLNTQVTTDDNGFLISLPPRKTLPDAVWARMLRVDGFDDDLLSGLRTSQLLNTTFRHVANTGLLVLRRAGGRSLRRGRQRWNAARILARLEVADREFPLLRETIRTVTHDLLDAPAARAYLEGIEGEPRVLHPPAATPFTFGIVTSSFGDSVVLDDRAGMVEALHARVLELVGEEPAGAQPEADPVLPLYSTGYVAP